MTWLLYINVGIDEDNGGSDATAWVYEQLSLSLKRRLMKRRGETTPPPSAWDILGPNEPIERQARKAGKAFVLEYCPFTVIL